ncbi:unnamed protein product [Euphydryas editha]|uniref:Uncharacterized protein n=1 Tax=Euphydryas editha TaxID=104508 RepID=A0AAU9U1E2_EUPED|nr:unnamed protein product [Euphydryas editha]
MWGDVMISNLFNITSTCLHHSQLEINEPDAKTVNEHSRTVPNLDDKIKTSCQRNTYNKKSVSISAQYKPIHNKSEASVKQKSCPLHKKKKIKEPDTLPYVSDHLIKTY